VPLRTLKLVSLFVPVLGSGLVLNVVMPGVQFLASRANIPRLDAGALRAMVWTLTSAVILQFISPGISLAQEAEPRKRLFQAALLFGCGLGAVYAGLQYLSFVYVMRRLLPWPDVNMVGTWGEGITLVVWGGIGACTFIWLGNWYERTSISIR